MSIDQAEPTPYAKEGPREDELPPFLKLCAAIFRGGLAGLIAGLVFAGIGSRVAMRVSALLDPGEEGALTENGNIVGVITFEGTLGLIIFVGIFFGLLSGGIWVLLRDWFPASTLPRVLGASVVAVCAAGGSVVTAENHDFLVLNPRGANIAMFLLLLALAGGATAVTDRLLEGRLPSGKTAGYVYAGLAGLGALVVVPGLIGPFFGDENRLPALLGVFLLLGALATCAGWVLSLRGGASRRVESWLRIAGMTGIVGVLLFGGLDLLSEIDAILSEPSTL